MRVTYTRGLIRFSNCVCRTFPIDAYQYTDIETKTNLPEIQYMCYVHLALFFQKNALSSKTLAHIH